LGNKEEIPVSLTFVWMDLSQFPSPPENWNKRKKRKKKRIENSKMVQELTTRPKILADPFSSRFFSLPLTYCH
jgi:hypothetical protein